ncbi:MAG: hypothetical protein ACXVCY_00485 [Pseudobdellovibrionaceae bacterium]
MKIWIRLFIFFLFFQVEIKVRASATAHESAADCIVTQGVCVFRAHGFAADRSEKRTNIHATVGSVLVPVSSNLWRFIKGNVWVEKSHGIQIETVYGQIKASRGQYWILQKDAKILIRNINAVNMQVSLRDGKVLNVPDGFEFWISGINTKGRSEFGMLQMIDIKEHLPLWYSLYQGDKSDFIQEVQNLRENWASLIEKSSDLYGSIALRSVASVKEKEEAQRVVKEQIEVERKRARKLYYQRVFER